MRSYSLLAAAKINLYLEILGDRPDGYHQLAMVMQSVDLADQIDLRPLSSDRIVVHCDRPDVPVDSTNLAYRAAVLIQQQFPEAAAQYGGVEITIHKRIPMGAGLAGGSTDAAAVLSGLNLMWQLGLTQGELQTLGESLGSDVPFCIMGGTALVTGRGEQLSPLPDLDSLYVVLGKYRSISVSTAWAYSTYRQQYSDRYIRDPQGLQTAHYQVHSGPMVSAIAHKDSLKIGQELHNDFEKIVFPQYPELVALRDAMQAAGVLGALMSGSGSTVFGLTESRAQAEIVQQTVRQALPNPDLDLWIAQFSPTGIRLGTLAG
ncbi:4-(cytidine 5'-diphospho)-2-C-methyl-D-erythritol kinase [Desertifilum sp. FACHB-1129]|uniref:4-diphosphocytidyl-2-C-methyl-D-erythritol kinase n=1 Tax=Desertifilum tharense IPPAS B-1220 TaxID=1781255 RepID=A0A1E5QDV1_9CYAN|nr:MULTISPECIES: 4-(cytidine 5'-diphospho)-2-C-methyl-D-erythritol kinase [Desertifilum]MDA0209053.1 4-(cytidine 5'-diphospho)-2-C-methyl-D-erythritol kinase [Cyanobacteria bacterium FC1]MBD2310535.1 4-(cytidine 5'-diphospho)-2-C-methyl-D-erythritol kinase [Desertifilum sp. FACHB-1129]MBD2321987.1 4-(cytidine 5'-diphospho)-2-C-methyl-D-erythritol kinase [Desertifilum sp. FACHB-866]MBD2332114.1 4-(cytidine 5'-diphospho)-2-C-methyl-D-erythritol kinase [Desertifilum sp. FACHB-868]OEJ72842.1 4-(cy